MALFCDKTSANNTEYSLMCDHVFGDGAFGTSKAYSRDADFWGTNSIGAISNLLFVMPSLNL
jgi:hypothetical protein